MEWVKVVLVLLAGSVLGILVELAWTWWSHRRSTARLVRAITAGQKQVQTTPVVKVPRNKLTMAQVLEIRENADDLTLNGLARKYGVSASCVWQAKKGTTWKHAVQQEEIGPQQLRMREEPLPALARCVLCGQAPKVVPDAPPSSMVHVECPCGAHACSGAGEFAARGSWNRAMEGNP